MLIPRINVLVECCPAAIQSHKKQILEQVKKGDSTSQRSWWPQSGGELSISISLAILNLFLAAVSRSGRFSEDSDLSLHVDGVYLAKQPLGH